MKFKLGDNVITKNTVPEFENIYGVISEISKYKETWITITQGNKYHKKGSRLYMPEHLLEEDK